MWKYSTSVWYKSSCLRIYKISYEKEINREHKELVIALKDTGETLIIGDIVISISKYNKVLQSHNKPWWAWVDWIINNLSILSELRRISIFFTLKCISEIVSNAWSTWLIQPKKWYLHMNTHNIQKSFCVLCDIAVSTEGV